MEDFAKDRRETLKACESDDSAGARETEYLLCSPKNAERLLEALARAERREGVIGSVEDLRRLMGLT